MQVDVGTTPEKLPVGPGSTPIVQNIGPGVLYLDFSSGVSADTGFQIEVGGAYEFPKDLPKDLYAVASVQTDVRILVVG